MRPRSSAWRALAALTLLSSAAACAHGSTSRLDRPATAPTVPRESRVVIVPPIVVGTAKPGNVGRDFVRIRADVTNLLLAIVHERIAHVDVANVTSEEYASRTAYGATYLLVTEITEWTQMRTDDPLGALIGPHDRVSLTLRLMRPDPPSVVASAVFQNRGRVTVNRVVALLDERFRRVVPGIRRVGQISQDRDATSGRADPCRTHTSANDAAVSRQARRRSGEEEERLGIRGPEARQ